jgi:hypothetical protein
VHFRMVLVCRQVCDTAWMCTGKAAAATFFCFSPAKMVSSGISTKQYQGVYKL